MRKILKNELYAATNIADIGEKPLEGPQLATAFKQAAMKQGFALTGETYFANHCTFRTKEDISFEDMQAVLNSVRLEFNVSVLLSPGMTARGKSILNEEDPAKAIYKDRFMASITPSYGK